MSAVGLRYGYTVGLHTLRTTQLDREECLKLVRTDILIIYLPGIVKILSRFGMIAFLRKKNGYGWPFSAARYRPTCMLMTSRRLLQ